MEDRYSPVEERYSCVEDRRSRTQESRLSARDEPSSVMSAFTFGRDAFSSAEDNASGAQVRSSDVDFGANLFGASFDYAASRTNQAGLTADDAESADKDRRMRVSGGSVSVII